MITIEIVGGGGGREGRETGGDRGHPRRCGPEGRGGRTQKNGAPKGWSPEPRKMGPRGAPQGGRPKILLFFLPLPPPFRSFCVSLGVFSLNFGGVFEGRGPEMFTFGVLGLSCEAPPAGRGNKKSENLGGPGEDGPGEGRPEEASPNPPTTIFAIKIQK